MNPDFNFRLIVTDSYHFFADNLRQIAALCLPFLLAGAVFNNVILGGGTGETDGMSAFFYSAVANLALNPIYTAGLILMMARRADREQPRNSELVSSAMGRYGPLLLLTLIQMGLMWAGFLLLIVPGVWVAVRISFADFYLVIEGVDPREAIVRSFQTTRRYFFPILVSLAIFALPLFVIGLLTGHLLQIAQAGRIAMALSDTLLAFLSLFLHVLLFRIFMEATRGGRQVAA